MHRDGAISCLLYTSDAADEDTRGPLAEALARAPRGSRAFEEHGLATLAEVKSRGALVGFGITCRCHNDWDDRPGTVCKKQLPLGNPPMSHAEAKLRLKRWYVAGARERFEAQIARTSHVKFGGRSLHMLASDAPGWCDVSEEDLNEMARRVGSE